MAFLKKADPGARWMVRRSLSSVARPGSTRIFDRRRRGCAAGESLSRSRWALPVVACCGRDRRGPDDSGLRRPRLWLRYTATGDAPPLRTRQSRRSSASPLPRRSTVRTCFIAASELDAGTERSVTYAADYDIPLNLVCPGWRLNASETVCTPEGTSLETPRKSGSPKGWFIAAAVPAFHPVAATPTPSRYKPMTTEQDEPAGQRCTVEFAVAVT